MARLAAGGEAGFAFKLLLFGNKLTPRKAYSPKIPRTAAEAAARPKAPVTNPALP